MRWQTQALNAILALPCVCDETFDPECAHCIAHDALYAEPSDDVLAHPWLGRRPVEGGPTSDGRP